MSRRRLPRAESQSRIVEKAIRLFSKHGFNYTSFQQIADACKIGQSTVLYHFPNKESLVEAVIQKIVIHNHALVSAAIDESDSYLTRLEKHFEHNFSWALKYREEAEVVILLYYLACSTKRFSAIYGKILAKARERICGYLEDGRRAGEFKFQGRAGLLAEILHDALLGGIINVLTVNPPPPSISAKNWRVLIGQLAEPISRNL